MNLTELGQGTVSHSKHSHTDFVAKPLWVGIRETKFGQLLLNLGLSVSLHVIPHRLASGMQLFAFSAAIQL